MATDMLKSVNGADSSKRIIGAVLISMGMIMLSSAFISAFFIVAKDPELIKYCITACMTAGTGLLLGGVVEYFSPVSKKSEEGK